MSVPSNFFFYFHRAIDGGEGGGATIKAVGYEESSDVVVGVDRMPAAGGEDEDWFCHSILMAVQDCV